MDLVNWPLYQFLATAAHFWIALGLVLLYWVGVLLARWNMIAKPSRNLLTGQIVVVRSRMKLEQDNIAESSPVEGMTFSKVEVLLSKAQELVSEASFWDRVFWSRGQEITGWRLVHEAERLLVLIQPMPWVFVRLQSACEELNKCKRIESVGLAQQVQNALEGPRELSGYDAMEVRALLQEALRVIYDEKDNSFAQLLTWHNKSVWMIAGALLFITILAAVDVRFSVLLFAGAIGGLLSRLARAVQSQNIPTDYGAFWMTLFLAPLMGALAGWAGLLLIFLLYQVGILGDLFQPLNLAVLDQLSSLEALFILALAVVLGFSERFFDQTADAVGHVFTGRYQNGEASNSAPMLPAFAGADGLGPELHRIDSTAEIPLEEMLAKGKPVEGVQHDQEE